MKAILQKVRGGEEKVDSFISYFTKTYVNHKHFRPTRWLHLGRKRNPFHDATNNVQEGKNHGFKLEGHVNLSFVNVCEKMKASLDMELQEYSHLSKSHSYAFSKDKSINEKTSRLNEKDSQLLLHRHLFNGKLKFYKSSK